MRLALHNLNVLSSEKVSVRGFWPDRPQVWGESTAALERLNIGARV